MSMRPESIAVFQARESMAYDTHCTEVHASCHGACAVTLQPDFVLPLSYLQCLALSSESRTLRHTTWYERSSTDWAQQHLRRVFALH